MNDSATGGYLAPSSLPAALTGQAFNRFLQQFVVGVTGLDGTMVRPRWQTEPANIPASGIAWASVGVLRRGPSDPYPFVHQVDDNTMEVVRNEDFTVLCSFYDTGANGLADQYAEALQDGLAIAQNRELLQLNEMNIVGIPAQTLAVPSLLKQLWMYRVDVEIEMRRRNTRRYPVKSLLAAQIVGHNNPIGGSFDDITYLQVDETSGPH